MLSINMSDVMSILELCRPYLIALGVIVVLAVIAIVAARKLPVTKKYLVRSQVGVAIGLAVTVIANLLCTGPLSTILTLASGSGTITEETSAEAEKLGEQIAEEGIVLLKNEDGLLPMTENKNVNVFGWASTNPVYGGTGSGALSGAYPIVDLLSGLENAGFTTNTELADFYRAYHEERPVVGMWEQDWTLPEPPVENYSEEIINNAKDFSETAMVVFSRPGGEHIDLPQDVTTVSYKNNS